MCKEKYIALLNEMLKNTQANEELVIEFLREKADAGCGDLQNCIALTRLKFEILKEIYAVGGNLQ